MKYNSKTTAIPEIIPVVLICTAGIILPRPDSSPACSFAPQGLFPPAGCISILLFSSTGIISTGRMHLYLPLLLHRDYFGQPNASLSSSFLPQGLFPPAGFISILLFCYTGMIPAGRMHPYPALFHHRDYFRRSDSSLSCSFLPQGLFPAAGCIPILLFSSTEIISAARIHLYLALFFHRDYFCRPDSSLSSSFASQGLFPPVGCISILLFCYTGIISTGRMHLYRAFLFHRDDFHRPDSSLSSSFAPQGLFPPVGFIPAFLFCSTGIILPRLDASLSSSFAPQGLFLPPGFISILLFCYIGIISAGRIHLYLALLLHRDYFQRPNASLSSSFVTQGLFPPPGFISILLFSSTGIILPRSDASLSSSFASQGLFPPAGFISIFLFCPTGMISAGRMHPQLALFFHRDYFGQPDASPACSFVTQGLFRPAECISNPGSCKVSVTKLLLHRKHSYGLC